MRSWPKNIKVLTVGKPQKIDEPVTELVLRVIFAVYSVRRSGRIVRLWTWDLLDCCSALNGDGQLLQRAQYNVHFNAPLKRL
jgi:hypothetical protein